MSRLMDHASDLRSDPQIAPHLSRLHSLLSLASYAPADVTRAYGVMRTNAFGFSSPQGGEGRALFARVSLLSHSCR